jgi:hypothetical protein
MMIVRFSIYDGYLNPPPCKAARPHKFKLSKFIFYNRSAQISRNYAN